MKGKGIMKERVQSARLKGTNEDLPNSKHKNLPPLPSLYVLPFPPFPPSAPQQALSYHYVDVGVAWIFLQQICWREGPAKWDQGKLGFPDFIKYFLRIFA